MKIWERGSLQNVPNVCVSAVSPRCVHISGFRMRGTQKGVHERVVCVCVEVSWRWSRGTAPEVAVL